MKLWDVIWFLWILRFWLLKKNGWANIYANFSKSCEEELKLETLGTSKVVRCIQVAKLRPITIGVLLVPSFAKYIIIKYNNETIISYLPISYHHPISKYGKKSMVQKYGHHIITIVGTISLLLCQEFLMENRGYVGFGCLWARRLWQCTTFRAGPSWWKTMVRRRPPFCLLESHDMFHHVPKKVHCNFQV